MKRIYFKTIFALLFLAVLSSGNVLPVLATDYIVTQITNNNYPDKPPQINENGIIVWSGGGTGDQEIFIHDVTTIQLTSTPRSQKDPQINNNNQVVWLGYDGNDYEVFFYDGYTIRQLTDNLIHEQNPQINDNGHMVWETYDGTDTEIYLYNGENIIQLTDNIYYDDYPQINNNNYVFWHGGDDTGYGVFLYDGNDIKKISNIPGIPQINNHGEVVWENSGEIFYYDGTTTIQLTNNSFFDGKPQINDNGIIVWEGEPDGHNSALYLYNGSDINHIVYYPDYHIERMKINNNGEVVWYAHFDGGSGWEIYIYNGKDVIWLTNNDYTDADPQINDNGDVVWYGGTIDGSTWEIYCARRKMILSAGFEPPCDNIISIKNINRSIPLRTELLDVDGLPITDADIMSPPIIEVSYVSNIPSPFETTVFNGLPPAEATDGNEFVFEDGKWHLNIKIRDYYEESGTYTIMMKPGDVSEYLIDSADKTVKVVVDKKFFTQGTFTGLNNLFPPFKTVCSPPGSLRFSSKC